MLEEFGSQPVFQISKRISNPVLCSANKHVKLKTELENMKMNCNVSQRSTRATILNLFVIALMFGVVGTASAQRVTPPATPVDITVPVGNTAFLVGHAFGSQGYTCLPTSTGGASDSRCRLSLTSPASMQILTTLPRSRYLLGAMPLGRVLSIPARCGLWQPDTSMPARTPVARIRVRFNA
jgi:hypothetical protein